MTANQLEDSSWRARRGGGMSKRRRGVSAIAAACAAAVAAGATAQDDAAKPTPPSDLLSGPKLESPQQPPTIVEREFDGELRLIEGDPEEEALRRLNLTPEQRERLEALAAERMSIFDRTLREHYGLVVELAGGFQSIEPPRRREITRTVMSAFAGWSRYSVLERMREHLGNDEHAAAKRMVDAYRTAHRQQVASTMGDNPPPVQVQVAISLQQFGQEVRRSIERQVTVNARLFDQLLEEIGVDPEQEATIRAIVQPFAVKQFQNLDTPADRMKLFREIRAVLTPDQQRRLMAYLAGRNDADL